jgi:CRP-like cAMP-binding protein
VKTGVLEILAAPSDSADPIPVAYLGKGEVLGELALLTGSPRTATARSPERAELFTLEKAVFLDLMKSLPPVQPEPLPRPGQAARGHHAEGARAPRRSSSRAT